MKCDRCPLSYWEESDWETGEQDLLCCVTGYAVCSDMEVCHRTNKWIRSQNLKSLLEKREREEIEFLEKYIQEMEQEDR